MATVFQDRQSTYPNRYKVTTDSGESYYVTLERADEPTVVGTPLNAATLNTLVSEDQMNEALGGKAKTGHKHAATDVNSGTFDSARLPTVPVAKGGTGATNAATARSNLGAAATTHNHKTSEITSGVFPVARGGTGASDAPTALKNLLAGGNMVLSSHQYGSTLPTPGTPGRIFFKVVEE